MRKVILSMMTTLNGRLDDPDAWVTGISDDQYTEINRVYATFDTVLVGQTTYEEMFAYWPGALTDNSEITRSMAVKMNTYRKFVFSGSDEKKTLVWNNSEQVLVHSDDDIISFITDLKSQQGGDIHLAGGARLAQTFIRLGLVDEYHFYIYPVVSPGLTWFDQFESNYNMELLSTTTYTNGVIGVHYKPC